MIENTDLTYLPISEIYYDAKFNCRGVFTPQSCLELSESIREHGLQFPIVVQPRADVPGIPAGFSYRLIAGHRRYIASKLLLGHTEIAAMVRDGLTEDQAKLINLLENLERKNLNVYEEAKALRDLFPPGTSIRSMSKAVQRSRDWCRLRVRLFELPKIIQENVARGVLTAYDLQYIMAEKESERISMAESLMHAKLKGFSTTSQRQRRGIHAKGRKDLHSMITRLMAEGLYPSPYAALMWAAGDITDDELFKDNCD